MIGKIQDVLSAAVVIGAADTAKKTDDSASQSIVSNENTTDISATPVDQQLNTLQTEQQNAGKEDDKKKDGKMDEKTVSQMTKELNKLMSSINCDLEFQYHKEVNVMSVKMVDKNTQEVIKEYPPEDMIKGMIKAREWIGAFLDRNA